METSVTTPPETCRGPMEEVMVVYPMVVTVMGSQEASVTPQDRMAMASDTLPLMVTSDTVLTLRRLTIPVHHTTPALRT